MLNNDRLKNPFQQQNILKPKHESSSEFMDDNNNSGYQRPNKSAEESKVEAKLNYHDIFFR